MGTKQPNLSSSDIKRREECKKKMSGKSFKLSKKIIYNILTYIWQKYILK